MVLTSELNLNLRCTLVCKKGGKRYHSINVHGVCNSKLRFINNVSKWQGSTHDSFILENSTFAVPEGWLLRESGYFLRPWPLTPVINPSSQPEEIYNASQIKTRNTVERSFDDLKSRLRCIDTSGETVLFPIKSFSEKLWLRILLFLHNFGIANGVPLLTDYMYVNARNGGRIGRPCYIKRWCDNEKQTCLIYQGYHNLLCSE